MLFVFDDEDSAHLSAGRRPPPRLGRLPGPYAPRRSLAGALCAPWRAQSQLCVLCGLGVVRWIVLLIQGAIQPCSTRFSNGQLNREGASMSRAVALGEHLSTVPGDDRADDEKSETCSLDACTHGARNPIETFEDSLELRPQIGRAA